MSVVATTELLPAVSVLREMVLTGALEIVSLVDHNSTVQKNQKVHSNW